MFMRESILFINIEIGSETNPCEQLEYYKNIFTKVYLIRTSFKIILSY